MLKANKRYMLILLLFAFAFLYRITFMLWQTFPPGADIGLHNTVIYSITPLGNTNFLYNNYQMGGGLSLTFPGYHIFASGIILMTGMSDFLAQAFVVALFSALIVLAVYLVTKAAWTESGALIVAFLVAVSRFDLEMTLWGGYPNVATLFLIPLTFYLYLQKDRFSKTPFIASTSILVASIFLTHSLSAVVFVGITVATVLVVLIRPKAFDLPRKHIFSWLLPIVVGAVLVAPFLFEAAAAYLPSNATLNGVPDINSALLSTRILPIEIIAPLFAILALFFVLSKEYRGRFVSLPAVLFFMWLLIPLLLSQGYLYKLYIDYNRFLYFLLLPVIVLFGMFLDHGAIFLARVINTYHTLTSQLEKQKPITNKYSARVSKHITRKNLYVGFITGFLLTSLFLIPLFVTPWEGVAVSSFYQVMNNPGYQAIQWAKGNTAADSVFVSDALYGWWLGGFSQRPTLSAVDPQYLSSVRELFPAKNASLLLDTDYMIDNGYIQVREDGGYLSRHNPEILAKLNWTYFPYSFFTFDSNKIKIDYSFNDVAVYRYANNLTVKNMQMQISPNNTSATIIVSRGNDLFNYTQFTTVYQNSRFVNITATLDSTVNGVALNYLTFQVESKGERISSSDNTVAWIDQGVKTLGQLIFQGSKPDVRQTVNNSPPNNVDLQYTLGGKSQGKIEVAAGAYSVTDDLQYYVNPDTIDNYFSPIVTANINLPYQQTYPPTGELLPIDTFDYQVAIQQWNISYLANRAVEMNPKFANDPKFNLVFINSEVAIFKIKANS
jgi:hypothetical protein